MLVSCKLQRATPIHFVKIHSVRGKKDGTALSIRGWQINLLWERSNGRRLIHCRYCVVFRGRMLVRPRLRLAVRGVMGLEYIIGLIVSLFILAYLVYALLWPEKF